uniref:BPTI/Kunitz inhibitor domain-containing protein n=1 Tax=Trichogramma kaykai TaxID=54128 RepID=A0ABD2WVW4_9HYME
MKSVLIFSCISALCLSVNGLPTLAWKIGPTSHRVWRPQLCATVPFHVSSGSQTFYRYIENTDSCVPFQADELPNWYGYKTKQRCDLECRNIIVSSSNS